MIEYIYIVKCPNCEDEHFHFFDDAKACAMGYISDKPIITQVEVERNDFGECTDSHDLGTVWSWEDLMADTVTEDEAAKCIFTKDDLKRMANGEDPEFDNLDNSVDVVVTDDVLEHINDRPVPVESTQKLDGIDNAVVDCGVANVVTHSEDEKPVVCKKPIPEGMSIKELVEAMEENEDTVECAGCEELFSKEDCFHKDGIGWLCGDCEDRIVKCTWCEELYDRSECRKEVDLGWLCDRCEAAIKSRGETLTFREGSYWDFLDEDFEDTRTLADLVKDSISHLTNDLGKDPWTDDFTDDVVADIENNYDVDVPSEPEKYRDWASAIACEVSRQLNNPLDEEVKELRDFDNGYDDTIPEENPELPEPDEALDSHLRLCPECGKETFDLETGICVDCGFN